MNFQAREMQSTVFPDSRHISNLLLPGHSAAFHLVRQLDVLAIDIELPLSLSEYPGEHRARMNAHPHVNGTVCRLLNIFDRLHHRQPHVYAEDRVVWPFDGCTTYTVVTVSQDLDAQLLVSMNKFVSQLQIV